MTTVFFTSLPHRSVLKLSGTDRVRFLQGLVTADIASLTAGAAAWAACLTPQGRWQYDFFVIVHPHEPCLLLECAAIQAEDLRNFLYRFRLRANVDIEPSSLSVHVAWNRTTWENSTPLCQEERIPPVLTAYCTDENTLCVPDPRLKEAGWRLINAPSALLSKISLTSFSEYEEHRLTLGLTDGVQDCEQGRTLASEANMDLLNGISFTKGCYMGQEITARLHYRHLLKQRLIPVMGTADLPPTNTPIFCHGVEVGRLRSTSKQRGLAFLKLEALDHPLTCDNQILTAHPPAWMKNAPPPHL